MSHGQRVQSLIGIDKLDSCIYMIFHRSPMRGEALLTPEVSLSGVLTD